MSSTFRKLTVIEGFDEEEVIEENQDLIPEEAKPVEIVPEKIPQDKGIIFNRIHRCCWCKCRYKNTKRFSYLWHITL